MTTKDRLQFIMEGGSVVRYHTRPGIKPDTDAHHSHGVAMMCSLLAGEDADGATKASAYLLMAALTHDLAEQAASDVSAPTKRRVPGLQKQLHDYEAEILEHYGFNYEDTLTGVEKTTLSLADSFDGMLYCCRELALGNRSVLLVWRRWCKYVEGLSTTEEMPLETALRAADIFESIKEIYHETTSQEGPNFDIFKQTESE
jgi:5'-deoxynucleotidase YfbR-like HD superfamily hydrolase